MFILFIKDNVAVAKGRYESIENINANLYDSYIEVTSDEFNRIEIPSKLDESGKWVKGDVLPEIEYPTIPIEEKEIEPNAQDDTDAMLIDHEYRLTLLELGVVE